MNSTIEKIINNSNIPCLTDVAKKLTAFKVNNHSNLPQFIQMIESDPILSSRILKTANSIYYGIHHKVTTLEQAISDLGIKYVRSIALGFELVSSFSNSSGFDFNACCYWQQNIYRSVLAHQMAKRYFPQRQEEAFLITLLLDCGIPSLTQIYGEKYAYLLQECSYSPTAKYQMEQRFFESEHATAGAALVRHLQLPELLARFIKNHHVYPSSQKSADGLEELSQIVYFVGNLPLGDFDYFTKEDKILLDFLPKVFHFEKADFLEILESTWREYHHITNLFSSFLPSQNDIAKLLIQSKMILDRYSQRECKRFDCQAAIHKLKEHKQKPPESVPQRSQGISLDEQKGLVDSKLLMRSLNHACQKVRNGKASLTVFFINLDDFQEINECYGNAGGDQVLEKVTKSLVSLIQDKGCIARYGKSQFVVALLDLVGRSALLLAKNVVEYIRQLKFVIQSAKEQDIIQITASMGMVFCENSAFVSNATWLLEFAQQQLYEVKNNRKDGFSYIVLNAMPPENQQAPNKDSMPLPLPGMIPGSCN
jgi:diguanylate cyclase (GGDEF)-like protein